MNAAKAGDLAEIERVLALRDDAVNLRNSHHNTALKSAVGAGQLEAARLLVKHGADIHQVNHGDSSMMESASIGCHGEMVQWLVSRGLDADIFELSAIGDSDSVRSMLDADPSGVLKRDRRGQTALHYAARCGHMEVIELLLKHGADVHALNKHGHEALAVAVEVPQPLVLQCLLEHDADPNASGGHFRGTVLHRAVLQRSLSMVSSLLVAGADPNRRDASGKTPLHDAVGTGNKKLVMCLLEDSRTDATLRCGETKFSDKGETPLEYALNRSKQGVAADLKAHLALK